MVVIVFRNHEDPRRGGEHDAAVGILAVLYRIALKAMDDIVHFFLRAEGDEIVSAQAADGAALPDQLRQVIDIAPHDPVGHVPAKLLVDQGKMLQVEADCRIPAQLLVCAEPVNGQVEGPDVPVPGVIVEGGLLQHARSPEPANGVHDQLFHQINPRTLFPGPGHGTLRAVGAGTGDDHAAEHGPISERFFGFFPGITGDVTAAFSPALRLRIGEILGHGLTDMKLSADLAQDRIGRFQVEAFRIRDGFRQLLKGFEE